MATHAPTTTSSNPSQPAAPAEPVATARPGRRRAMAAGAALPAVAEPPLRKPVNALAIVPQSRRITPLFRKSYNVMLYLAQEQGIERDVYRAPVSAVLAGLDFDSNDTSLVKRHLRAMATTAVEWQSPTKGEGAGWAISGLIGHAEIRRERGQNWLEWSYSVKLKQELLQPSVFARLSIEIISQLRTHGGIALYEICSRYRDVGRSARQHWTWWRPVLSGKPETEKQKQLEYRFFKRDVLKKAVAEVNAVTDLEVELVEHKQGRFIADLQFVIRRKQQVQLPLQHPPAPVDMSLVVRAARLGIDDERGEQLLHEHGSAALATALDTLEKRLASAFPEPLRDPYRYLRSVLPGQVLPGRAAPSGELRGGLLAGAEVPAVAPSFQSPAAAAAQPGVALRAAGSAEVGLPVMDGAALPPSAGAADPAGRDTQAKRRGKWAEEWLRRRRERIATDLAALSTEAQQQLSDALLADMQARSVHPSIRKRLQTSGWQHAMVIHEMLRFYAQATIGDHWDTPSSEQLLEVAAQLGDTA